MTKEYYMDTCIWLNLFKKEGNSAIGIPYWKLARDFIGQVEENKEVIIVSTIVLKELYFKLGERFATVKHFLKDSEFIKIVKTSSEDYNLAREFEQQHQLLSFYDYLHVAIAKRLAVSLITRDNDLLEFARNHIKVFKPEDLLS